jgi:hypothetical protein
VQVLNMAVNSWLQSVLGEQVWLHAGSPALPARACMQQIHWAAAYVQ